MRAVIYARVSLDKRGQGLSVTEQIAECQAWADREGWTVDKVISETGSASRYARSTGARTRWTELTNTLAARQHEILVTWESSRATRELGVYADLRDLCAKTNVLWGYSGTVYDLSNRADRFKTGLDALMSEDESHRTSERVLRSVRSRAAAGRPHGKIPYGYRREYDTTSGALLRQVPDEETAPNVAEMFQRTVDGDSLYAIARDFTERGIPMPRPARNRHNHEAWIPMTIRQILRSPTYVAKRVHKGEIVSDAQWPAIVTDELHAAANAHLDARTISNPTGDATARWLLSGIAHCGKPQCHGPMRRIQNRGSPSYTCNWCYGTTRLVDKTDATVTDKLLALIRHVPTDATSTSSDEAKVARAQAKALQTRLDEFTDQGADGSLSSRALARIEARLLPQIHTAEAKAKRLEAPTALARYDLSDPVALWDSLDVPGKRGLLRAAVTVTILPAGGGHRTWNDDLIVVRPTWAPLASETRDGAATERP